MCILRRKGSCEGWMPRTYREITFPKLNRKWMHREFIFWQILWKTKQVHSHFSKVADDFHCLTRVSVTRPQPVAVKSSHQPMTEAPHPLLHKWLCQIAGNSTCGTLFLLVRRSPNLCIILHCGLVHSVNGLQGILKETIVQKLLTSHSQAKSCTYDKFQTTTHVWNLLPQ